MRKSVVLLYVIANIVFLTGCQDVLNMPVGIQENTQMSTTDYDEVYSYEMTRNDYNTSETGALKIDLSNLSESMVDIYTFDSGQLTIHAEGSYILTGNLSRGNLIIHVYDDEIVHLILDNVEISSYNNPAIYVENADKVILTLKEGTENILSDGSGGGEMHKACIFSNSDLTINGAGMLYVYGYHADGVRSKDYLKLANTNLFVRAERNGLRGNDAVIIMDSMTEIESEGTGILSNSESDMVVLQGGSCKVIAGENAIASNSYISIHDCITDLYSILETIKCNGILDISEG